MTRIRDKEKQREYARRHYAKNKVKMKERAIAHKAKQRKLKQDWILQYLKKNPCVDCGESDPIVLEFDHRNPAEKRFALGLAHSKGFGLDTIIAEVAKCDVRCANCHRRKTYHEMNRKHRG